MITGWLDCAANAIGGACAFICLIWGIVAAAFGYGIARDEAA